VPCVHRESFVEGVQQADYDEPEDDARGDAVAFGYFFVEVLVLHVYGSKG
jgi:hypothetical protein